jgi:hypothetical protein
VLYDSILFIAPLSKYQFYEYVALNSLKIMIGSYSINKMASSDIDATKVLGSSAEHAEQSALYDLFEAVVEYGKQVRQRKLNGFDMWGEIKTKFSDETGQCKWNIDRTINAELVSDLDAIYNYIHDDLGMAGDDDKDIVEEGDADYDAKHALWENRHFFLQLIRIAKKNECSLMRLMQVAYNVGQFQADLDNPIYTEKVKNFYDANKMGSLHSYVNPAECSFGGAKELSSKISTVNQIISEDNEMGGGSDPYYRKYLKYKTKYLQLRNNRS